MPQSNTLWYQFLGVPRYAGWQTGDIFRVTCSPEPTVTRRRDGFTCPLHVGHLAAAMAAGEVVAVPPPAPDSSPPAGPSPL